MRSPELRWPGACHPVLFKEPGHVFRALANARMVFGVGGTIDDDRSELPIELKSLAPQGIRSVEQDEAEGGGIPKQVGVANTMTSDSFMSDRTRSMPSPWCPTLS